LNTIEIANIKAYLIKKVKNPFSGEKGGDDRWSVQR